MVRAKHRTLGVRGVDARVGFRVRQTRVVWAMWLGLLVLGAERWSCALEAAKAGRRRRRRGGGCARGAAQKARGRHRAAARACEDDVLRRRRLAVAAYGGGEVERRRRERVGCGSGAAAARRKNAGETEEGREAAARARLIYDRRAPQISLTPVKPMPRFRAPVDCIGAVHPRLLQKSI